MAQAARYEQSRRAPHGAFTGVFWFGLAMLAALSVFLLNGRVLYYFDTPNYVAQGTKILGEIGFPAQGTGGGEALAKVDGDHVVNGTRAAVYSVMTALVERLGGMSWMPVANFLLIWLALWLPVRVLARRFRPHFSTGALVALPVVAASLGSLPFYVAFIMPDILTPVLLLSVATLTVFYADMRLWEIILALVLGCFAVVAHISHIPIAAVLVPVSLVGAWISPRVRWWVPPLLVGGMVLAGLAERAAFTVAAQKVGDAKVVYAPFLTARLIEDGPGLDYINTFCPDDAIPTCAMKKALAFSDDPYRLTASHIVFETSPRLGSFRLLPIEEQASVARDQYAFFVNVALWAPVSTGLAILRNTLAQARRNSVLMTIPEPIVTRNIAQLFPELAKDFSDGRLTRAPERWLAFIDPAHKAFYMASLGIVVLFLLFPGRVPLALRGFAVMILLGILANAFVTGAASQPADRYGARVIWLLPFLAGLMALIGFGGWVRDGERE